MLPEHHLLLLPGPPPLFLLPPASSLHLPSNSPTTPSVFSLSTASGKVLSVLKSSVSLSFSLRSSYLPSLLPFLFYFYSIHICILSCRQDKPSHRSRLTKGVMLICFRTKLSLIVLGTIPKFITTEEGSLTR